MKFKTLISFFIIFFLYFLFLFYKEATYLSLERPSAWVKDLTADCAVVLTGGYGRVREGFSLLSQQRVKKLIISGVYPSSQLREIFPQWPYYPNLKSSDVILEKRSKTTYGNAQQSLPLVEALNCKNILLVTSALHMPRALNTFNSVFPESIPINIHSIAGGSYKPEKMDIFSETIKTLFYKLWAY